MATREFESSYIHQLCVDALDGLDNHIVNEWKRKSRYQYNWQVAEMERKNKSRLRKIFRCKPITLPTFEVFSEERKQALYSQYSETYTLWKDHYEKWIGTDATIQRIKQLSAENWAGSKDTRIDDSEFNTVSRYAKVVLE